MRAWRVIQGQLTLGGEQTFAAGAEAKTDFCKAAIRLQSSIAMPANVRSPEIQLPSTD